MPSRSREAAPPRAPKPRSENARASSPSNRCNCTAPWASPKNSTSAPISSGSPPSTRCSAAAPTIIAATPPWVGGPTARPEHTMDLSFSTEERGFEKEVRDFIAQNLTPEMKRATALTPSVFSDPDIGMAWQRALHKKGWGAPGWPVEHGGPDWTPAQRWIFEAECARAGVPNVNVMGVKMVGPVIIGFGSPEQKNFYLPKILSGEDYWCQGYSEPGSGSDLSSLKTRAVRDGDDYIVNGTKIWTTHAHYANRMFALVRTNDTERQQDGISFILIDMKSPGITTRPILTIGGDHEVNQVFFDDVRVPVANRVGEEGKGWTYGKYLLEFERGSGIASAKLRDALKTVSDLAESETTGRAIDDPDIAVRMSEIEVDIDTLEMTELRVLSALQTGQNPGAVSSLLKLRVSEIRQAVTRLGVEVIGNDGLYVEPIRPLYRLNETPGISEQPGVYDFWRLVGDPAGYRGEDGVGVVSHSTVVPGRCEASNPEPRDSPMCNCTSEVRTGARPGMTMERGRPYTTAFASLIACQILAGVSGVLSCLMPSSLSA